MKEVHNKEFIGRFVGYKKKQPSFVIKETNAWNKDVGIKVTV